LGSRLQWGFVPAEALHGRGVRDESSVALSAGSQAGVQRMSPVVAPEGLVGIVDNVDPTMSHALLWTNPDFRVSAMSEDGSAFGIVQAHVETGPGKYLLEMRGVPFRTSVKPNTMIVSSGLGGVYPRGIPVGRVIGETKTTETWARTYLIRPAVFPGDVSSVMILKPERASDGVNNVWASGAASDTSVKKIVTAGDSMARAAALAEARARQAVQDSITRRDSIAAARAMSGGVLPQDTAHRVVPRPPASTPRTDSARRDSARRTPSPGKVAPAKRDSAGLPTTL
jgi:rod shape-determining protein MreC